MSTRASKHEPAAPSLHLAEIVDGPLAAAAEQAFAEERARPMRVRVLFIAVVSFLIWTQQFVLYEKEIFSSRTVSLAYRSVEALLCIGLVGFLWRPRPLRQVEGLTTAGFAFLSIAHFFAVLFVKEAVVVPFTLTAEWGMMVIALASLMSFRPTLVLLTVTWVAGTLATSARARWDTDLSDHLILLGIYAVLLAAVRSFDKLRRREFVGRVRLEDALSEVRRAEEVRGRLFVNLSHDFRTPLALIHGEAELLGREQSETVRASALERVRAQTMGLAELTNELLELARLEAGKTPRRTAQFDARSVAHEIAAQFQNAGDGRVVRVLEHETAGDAAGVSADPSHVRRILTNLVANAVRNVPASGEVCIGVRPGADDVTIDVVDDGSGIDPSRRKAIFERFASFDATGSIASGIGLPVARELAELNEGSLELVEDAPRTTFRLTLPRGRGPLTVVNEAPPRSAQVGAPLAPSAASATAPSPPRSLVVVEDHQEMRRLLCEQLGSRFSIRIASTCAEARAALSAERPSAILCDVLLPDGNGYDILEWVRMQRRLDGVPLLFLSALGTPEQRARGMVAGADDYIAKPFSSEELIARLDAACVRTDERMRALEALRLHLLAELHDGVTASLSRAALLLTALERPGAKAELLDGARGAVTEGLAEARKIMSLIDGGAASWDHLVDDLRSELETTGGAFSIRAEVSAENDGSTQLFSALETHTVRRVAREALTNALKHGLASHVQCALVVRDGQALLSVDDDSAGGVRGEGTGRGLGIAERRVRMLGGELTLEPRTGGGSTLRASFPLQFGLCEGTPKAHLARKPGEEAAPA